MKRSGPLERRTPLQRKTPLRSKTPLTRRRLEARQTPKKRPPRGSAGFDQETRALAAERAGGRCECCGQPLETWIDTRGNVRYVFDAHHRLRRSQGGPDTVENCAVLTHEHHMYWHEHPSKARERGFLVMAAHDPAAWVVILWDGRTVRLTEDGQYEEVWAAGDAA